MNWCGPCSKSLGNQVEHNDSANQASDAQNSPYDHPVVEGVHWSVHVELIGKLSPNWILNAILHSGEFLPHNIVAVPCSPADHPTVNHDEHQKQHDQSVDVGVVRLGCVSPQVDNVGKSKESYSSTNSSDVAEDLEVAPDGGHLGEHGVCISLESEFLVGGASSGAFDGDSVSGPELHLYVGGLVEGEEGCSDFFRCHGFCVGQQELGPSISVHQISKVSIHTSNYTTTGYVILQDVVDGSSSSIAWDWVGFRITAWFVLHFNLEVHDIAVSCSFCGVFTGEVSFVSGRSTCCSCVHQLCNSSLVTEPEPLVSVTNGLVVGSRNVRGIC